MAVWEGISGMRWATHGIKHDQMALANVVPKEPKRKDTDHTSEDRCEHEDCGHGGAACRLRYPSGRFVLGLHRGDEEPLKMTPPPIIYTI